MLKETILSVIIEELNDTDETTGENTSLYEFFDDDSDVIGFAIDMEEIFGASLLERDLMKLDTIGQLVNILHKRIKE